MNWKQLLYKVGKGAVSGAASAIAGIQVANFFGGHADTKTMVLTAAGSVVGAALHGAANVIEQYTAK